MQDASRLMERVRARDADAFESLYDRYHALVYGLALRVLADPSAAEDVTQNVFLKIWTAPDAFQSGNLEGWLARVARNRAIDVLRSKKLRSESELSESIPADSTLEQSAMERLDGERARAAMGRLPDEQRLLLELGFFGGMTHDAIARQTGLPLGTVKTRIRSGLRRLRELLHVAIS
ncbi:MAG TPA: sigma-70 family RNA polymerase sigma factor [Candidatus Tumulicola sp.]